MPRRAVGIRLCQNNGGEVVDRKPRYRTAHDNFNPAVLAYERAPARKTAGWGGRGVKMPALEALYGEWEITITT